MANKMPTYGLTKKNSKLVHLETPKIKNNFNGNQRKKNIEKCFFCGNSLDRKKNIYYKSLINFNINQALMA